MNALDESRSRFRKKLYGATPVFRFLMALSFVCIVVAYLLIGFPRLLGLDGALVAALLLMAAFFIGVSSSSRMGCIFAVLAIVSFVVVVLRILGSLNVGVA